MLVLFLFVTLAWIFGSLHAYLGKVYLLVLFEVFNYIQVCVVCVYICWMYMTIPSVGNICCYCLLLLELEDTAEKTTELLS